MENQPAPDSIAELMTCECKRSVCNDECQCCLLSIKCTDLCRCRNNCDNVQYAIEESDNDVDDESDEDDSDMDLNENVFSDD